MRHYLNSCFPVTIIKAWADGAEIEEQFDGRGWEEFDDGHWMEEDGWEYRIKPEPKPDVVRYLKKSAIHGWFETNHYLEGNSTNAIIKLTFDGETGELKSAEVCK